MAKSVAKCDRNSQYPARSTRDSPGPNSEAIAGRIDRMDRRSRARASAPDGGGREGLLDQHDGDVGDDRIDQAGGGAVEPLLHDRLLVPEVLAVFLHQRPPQLPGELDQLQLALRLRADQDLQ